MSSFKGIKVLEVKEVAAGSSFSWASFVMSEIVVASFIALSVVVMLWPEINCMQIAACTIGGLIVGAPVGIMTGCVDSETDESVLLYTVDVSECEHLDKFYNMYVVVEQDGNVLTVKER